MPNLTATARHFADSDRNAPRTPWGKAQRVVTVQRGVRWVSTASHGGLGVSVGVASKSLTPAAIAQGFVEGGYIWFEEDCQCNAPFGERPEWWAAIKAAVNAE